MRYIFAPLMLLVATPAFAGTYDVRDPAMHTDFRPLEVTDAVTGTPHMMTAEEEARWREGFRHAQRNAWTKFWILQGLSAADAATTCIGVANGAREMNPIYGSHPSCSRVVGIKAGLGVLQYFLLRHDLRDRPHKTGKALNIVIALQGAVVVSNIVQLAK